MFYSERQKGSGWEGRWGRTGRSRGGETLIRTYVRNIFSIKGKKKEGNGK